MCSDDILPSLESAFSLRGFSCETGVDLGPAVADLYCSMRVRWFWIIPYILRYFVFTLPPAEKPTLPLILGLHALSRAYTDRSHKRSRWLRWTIPVTATIVLSIDPFDDETTTQIRNHKHRYQMGDVNTVVLANTKHRDLYCLERTGFIAYLPLHKTNVIIRELLQDVDIV